MVNSNNPPMIYTVEDCLEIMMGFSDILVSPPFELLERDKKILQSIGSKTFKGVGLTDKQLAVIKKILLTNYVQQFSDRGIDLIKSLEQLRGPLRELDRSTFIKIEKVKDIPELNQVYNKGNFGIELKVIVLRFPFNMSYARLINDIKKKFRYDDRYFNYNNHYLFPYEEKYVYHLIYKFKDKIKDIDPELLEVYKKLCEINEHPDQHIPGIYDYQIRNVPNEYINHLHNNIGIPSKENLYLYQDRRQALALEFMNNSAVQESLGKIDILSQKIALRKTFIININKNKWTLDQVIGSLNQLLRFPLLVVLNEKTALNDYHEIYSRLKLMFLNSQHSVMFRLPNHGDNNIEFNQRIAEDRTNNLIDENTKVVYISHKRVPKPLIKSKWQARAAISLRSEREHNQVQNFLQQYDLIMQYDNEESPWNMWHHEVEII
jgi:hypothetical protein